jgi:hypothetical protein
MITREGTWQTQGEKGRTAGGKARTRLATSSLPRLVGRWQSVSNSRVHESRQVLHVRRRVRGRNADLRLSLLGGAGPVARQECARNARATVGRAGGRRIKVSEE